MKPTSDSDINIEVWLPIEWNGRLMAVGNGDAKGVISYGDDRRARPRLRDEFDRYRPPRQLHGLRPGHRQKYVDFGYRSLH